MTQIITEKGKDFQEHTQSYILDRPHRDILRNVTPKQTNNRKRSTKCNSENQGRTDMNSIITMGNNVQNK